MSALGLVNPAGGLHYHLRALRYSKSLWQPFRWALGEWLLGWAPPETTLVLVGPSGGYNLQPFLFERFQQLVCLEPDPIARWVFARRLARAPLDARPKLEFVSDDHLIQQPERLLQLLDRLGSACVLFSNVIGQLRALLEVGSSDAAEFVRVREAVTRALDGRSWASFHDRLSGHTRPGFEQTLLADSRLSDREIIEAAYAAAPGMTEGSESTELLDHLTEGFFPERLPHIYFSWELGPGLFHLIEGVHSTRPRLLGSSSST